MLMDILRSAALPCAHSLFNPHRPIAASCLVVHEYCSEDENQQDRRDSNIAEGLRRSVFVVDSPHQRQCAIYSYVS